MAANARTTHPVRDGAAARLHTSLIGVLTRFAGCVRRKSMQRESELGAFVRGARVVSIRGMSPFDTELDRAAGLVVSQRKELGELFGVETRNKYEIRTLEGASLGFAAEQQKGVLGFLARQFLGHWRSFEILIFDALRQPVLSAQHPFRWFFQRLEVTDAAGRMLGAVQRRFSFISKRFDVEDPRGQVLLTVHSPLWRPWTFTFERRDALVATIHKRWSGSLKELFLDADKFVIELAPGPVYPVERRLLVAAAIFVDLMFFEKKAS